MNDYLLDGGQVVGNPGLMLLLTLVVAFISYAYGKGT